MSSNVVRSSSQIKKLCDQIARAFHPERIILFGSHAYGRPSAESDIDLLVVMRFAGRHTQQAIRILNSLDVLAPIDLLVRTPQQIRQRIAKEDPFIREILERGKVMYEAYHTGVDRQG